MVLCFLVAALALALTAAEKSIYVDCVNGVDAAVPLAGTQGRPLKTVHAAAALVREYNEGDENITVYLSAGLHHVGDQPLRLDTAHDGGFVESNTWVTWKSADAATPAVVGAPIQITGWTKSEKKEGSKICSYLKQPCRPFHTSDVGVVLNVAKSPLALHLLRTAQLRPLLSLCFAFFLSFFLFNIVKLCTE